MTMQETVNKSSAYCEQLECKNNGTKKQDDYGNCWCVCLADFQGHHDCSRRTETDPYIPEGMNIILLL